LKFHCLEAQRTSLLLFLVWLGIILSFVI